MHVTNERNQRYLTELNERIKNSVNGTKEHIPVTMDRTAPCVYVGAFRPRLHSND